ncbi:MAG: glycosyltransferase family 4 protein [Gemmatimonadetes bacterium]|nr:glycosyltransferase family 4 protein [Gemmatimonadota bacterium]
MTGLRILVVNWLDRENPQAGGAETHLHEIFGRLANRGHSVTALVSGWAGCEPRARLDGIEVHRTGRRYTFSLAAPRYFRRHLSDQPFDVVVEDLNKVPLFARFWAGAPVVLLAHHLFGGTAFQAGPFPVALATWWLERPIPLLYRGLPAVAVSESTRDDLVARGLRAEHIEVIPNGIDIDRYTPAPGEKTVSPTLVFVGRLKEYKRVDLILEAVDRLGGRGLNVLLDVVGKGEREVALRGQADRLGVADRVHFHGFVSEGEKVEFLRRSWVHVLTSPKEGWGISAIEAAACGTPTVASDAPGLRESVVDGETGVLVPHGDAGALADALEGLLRDVELRTRLGRQARAFAEGFSWDESANAIEALLRRVAESPSGGRRQSP